MIDIERSKRPSTISVTSFASGKALAEKRETLRIPVPVYEQMLQRLDNPDTNSSNLFYSEIPLTEKAPMRQRFPATSFSSFAMAFPKAEADDTSALFVKELTDVSIRKPIPNLIPKTDLNSAPANEKRLVKKIGNNLSFCGPPIKHPDLSETGRSSSRVSNETEKAMDVLFENFKAKGAEMLEEEKPKLSRNNSILKTDSLRNRSGRKKQVEFSKHKTVYLIGTNALTRWWLLTTFYSNTNLIKPLIPLYFSRLLF